MMNPCLCTCNGHSRIISGCTETVEQNFAFHAVP